MRALAYIGFTIGLLSGIACTREQLDYRKQEGYVHLALSWEEEFAPAGSRVYFFPTEGGEVLMYDCPSEGFKGVLPVGSYRILVHNNDCSSVSVRNTDSFEAAEIYVLPEEVRSGAYIQHADPIAFTTTLNEAEMLEVPYRDTVRVSAMPCLCVKEVGLVFEVVPPVEFATCTGSLSGVSASIKCSTAESSDTSSAVRFTAVADAESDTFHASISVLDLLQPDGSYGTHILDLLFTDASGASYPLQTDVTSEVNKFFTENGEMPDEITLQIRISQVGGRLTASVVPWDGGGTGGGSM